MKSAIQLVVRQSGTLAFALFVFALGCGAEVCQGLWQGSGLHGYLLRPGNARTGGVISVWTEFLMALALAGAAGVFACVALWRRMPRVSTHGILLRK